MPHPLALSVDFGQGFTDAWTAVATFVPKFIAFLVILLIGRLLAKPTARVVDRLLRRVGFERLAERSGVAHALRGSQYDATGILVRILYYGILLVTLQLGFGVFGPNPVSGMINSVVAWLPKALVACVIVVVAMALARAVRDIVRGALGESSYGRGLSTVAWACIVALGVIAALGQAEIATSVTGPVLTAALATIAGILIVGVGGGLIQPMRRRWERWLSIAEQEAARVREEPESGPPTTPRRKPPAGPTGPGEGPDFIDPM